LPNESHNKQAYTAPLLSSPSGDASEIRRNMLRGNVNIGSEKSRDMLGCSTYKSDIANANKPLGEANKLDSRTHLHGSINFGNQNTDY